MSESLLEDIHHLTFVTADMDRLIDFYERLFDARVTLDLEEEGVHHAFLQIGPHTVLHPFQVPGVDPPGKQEMFARGRLDHFGLRAASEEAFWELRRRVIEQGAGDGFARDMGSLLNLGFTDSDAGEHEIIWVKPGVPIERGFRRQEWTIAAPAETSTGDR